VSSATSEAAANVPFQAAPQRFARPDPSQGNDSFGALVDSNTAADTGNDRAPAMAQQQSASQRRPDDTPPAADNGRSRDAATADQAATKDSGARGAAAAGRSDANANANANTDAVPGSKATSGKADDTKSTAKSSSGDSSAADSSADPAASAKPDGQAATTPNALAVAIPVTVAAVNAPVAPPASGNATAPLAIAAAAIAATSAATAAPAASSAQTKIDSAAAAAATASADATATATGAAATAKINVQVAASQTVATPANPVATQTGATLATGAAVATAVAGTAPVTAKTTPAGAPVASRAQTAASGSSDTASGTPDPSTPAGAAHTDLAPQPAVAGKPAGNDPVGGPKADPSAGFSSIAAAAVSAHDHSLVAEAGHTPTGSIDTGAQATGTIQPQINPPAVTPAPAGPLSVALATNAAVPLTGLAVEIAVSARSGKSSFEIRLDPADLGRIDVRIDVDRNGQLTSHLMVEKPETLTMLRQDAPQLQRALDDAGFRTGNDGLQFSLRDQSSSGRNNSDDTGRNAQRLVISDEDTIPATVAGRTYGRVLASSSGVDIRV
jgi:flagellar hook-length control protein FliK